MKGRVAIDAAFFYLLVVPRMQAVANTAFGSLFINGEPGRGAIE